RLLRLPHGAGPARRARRGRRHPLGLRHLDLHHPPGAAAAGRRGRGAGPRPPRHQHASRSGVRDDRVAGHVLVHRHGAEHRLRPAHRRSMTPMAHQWRGVLAEYREHLPFAPTDTLLTLGEGGTPLVPAPALSRMVGADVHIKVEGMNPTGSFKDRGMVSAMTKAKNDGASAVVCASTGNTSASAAAYATAAGMTCAVLLPQGKIAAGKLA